VILVRRETSPADIAGMAAACGLVTALGGLVSHAAVIARSWGVPAVVGVSDLRITERGIVVGGRHIHEGDLVTIDGDEGLVMLGDHPADEIEVEEVQVLRRWQRDLSAAADTSTPSSGDHPADDAAEVDATEVERVLGLKGFGDANVVAAVLGASVPQVESIVEALVERGEAQALAGGRVRLLGEALARVNDRFAQDAAHVGPLIEPVWEQFHVADARFKLLVTAWQTREVDGQMVPNEHQDASYDQQVIGRLRAETHPEISTIIDRVAAAVSRLSRYQVRFDRALAALEGGDGEMMAHPMRDSYHTVWFELHEELIRLTGRNRADEAAAGRG
jgi:pyruvate,orthophosphate dikinase